MSPLFFVIIAFVVLGGIGIFSRVAEYKNHIEEEEKEDLVKLEQMENDDMNKDNSIENTPVEDELQTVGEKVQAVLKAQGIPFDIDEEGDVCFEYRFHRYVLNKSQSTNGFFLDLAFGEKFDEQSRMIYIQAANCLHAMFRLIKMTVYENGFVISMDSITPSNTDYKQLLRISLNLLEEAYNELGKILSSEKEEQSKPVSTIDFNEAQQQMRQESEKGTTDEMQSEEKENTISQSPSIGFNAPKYKP